MKQSVAAGAIAAIFLLSATGYAGAADVKAGSRVFNKCKSCHSLTAGKNLIGPSLAGLFGRTAGTAAKYNYSSAMKKAGAGGLVWSEETLLKYLASPREFVKGNKMTFVGLKKESERENIIAFLKEAAK